MEQIDSSYMNIQGEDCLLYGGEKTAGYCSCKHTQRCTPLLAREARVDPTL